MKTKKIIYKAIALVSIVLMLPLMSMTVTASEPTYYYNNSSSGSSLSNVYFNADQMQTGDEPSGGGFNGCIPVTKGYYWWSFLPLKRHGYGVGAFNWLLPFTGEHIIEQQGTTEIKLLNGDYELHTWESWTEFSGLYFPWRLGINWLVKEQYKDQVDFIRIEYIRRVDGGAWEHRALTVYGNNEGGGGSPPGNELESLMIGIDGLSNPIQS